MTADDPLARAQSEISQAEQAFDRADFPAALARFRSAVDDFTLALGAEHRQTAAALAGVGKALNALGEYSQARPLVEQALAIQRRGPGPMRSEAAASQHLLGEIIANTGSLPAGERLLDAACRARRAALGDDHPDTLDSLTLWATYLHRLGQPDAAEPHLVEGARRSLQALGDAHRVTGRALLRLGLFYARSEPTYLQARRTYEQALEVNRRAFGPQHPVTGQTMNNLAALLVDLGEIEPAAELFRSSLALHETACGRQHPLTAFVLLNLADVYTRQRDHPSAFTCLARAWIIWLRALGWRHAQTTAALRKLVAAAGRLEQEGGDATMRAFGMGLQICMVALESAAGSLDPAGHDLPGRYLDPQQAADRLEAWAGRMEAWLSRPPLTPVQWKELEIARRQAQEAGRAAARGDYPAAQAAFQAALAVQERVLGPDHLDHAALLYRLASLAQANNEPVLVLPLLERNTRLHDRLLGREHPSSVLAFSTYTQRYDYEYGSQAALPYYRQLLERQVDAFGPDDPTVERMRQTIDAMLAPDETAGAGQEPPVSGGGSLSERIAQSLAGLDPERQKLLDGIERLDWHTLQHAYGPATHVPDLLRRLLVNDSQVRDEGWRELYSTLWHQGTVYEASAAAVPFLLRMLAAEPPPEKIELLVYLAALATGSSYLEVHAARDPLHTDWNAILAGMGRGDLDTELRREQAWVQAANDAVAGGIPLYLELLDRSQPDVQKQAAYTLACLPRHAARIVPALLARLPRLQPPRLRLAVVRVLRSLMDAGPEAQHVFGVLLHERESLPVRFEAASALVERQGERTPPPVVAVLIAIWRQARAGDVDFDLSDTWPLEDQAGDLRVLQHLGAERGSRVLLEVLEGLDDPWSAMHLASILLDLVFQPGQALQHPAAGYSPDVGRETLSLDPRTADPPERRRPGLAPEQRRVLKELLAHPAFWRAEHNLLRQYGLPSERKALRRFLARA